MGDAHVPRRISFKSFQPAVYGHGSAVTGLLSLWRSVSDKPEFVSRAVLQNVTMWGQLSSLGEKISEQAGNLKLDEHLVRSRVWMHIRKT